MKQILPLLVATLAPSIASADAPPPAWCAQAPSDAPYLAHLQEPDVMKVMATLVAAPCHPTVESENNRAQIEQARQAWGKKLGMIESDWADAADYAKRGESSFRRDLSTKDLAAATPVDQWILITQTSSGKNSEDALYAADSFEPNLSEVGRLGVIMECFKDHEVEWAVCQQDVDAFDLAKFSEQLRKDTAHTGALRQHLRYLAYDLPNVVKEHAEKIARVQHDDDGYKKVWDVAAKARREFKLEPKLRALALQMESAYEAQSRKLFEGCDGPTFAALAEAAAKIPGAQTDNMKDIRDSPSGGFIHKAGPVLVKDPSFQLAAIAVSLCDARPVLALVLGQLLKDAPGARGPREYALGVVKTSAIVLDRKDAQLSYPIRVRPYEDRRGGAPASVGGAVKSVKKEGDKLVVQLEPLMVKQTDCVAEHTTNHVVSVRDSGTLEYERRCDKFASVVHNGQWPPMHVPASYEKDFKVGNIISILGGDQNNGDLIAVWPTVKSPHPTWLFGGAVK